MGKLFWFELEKLLKKKLVGFSMIVFSIIYMTMLWSWTSNNGWAVNQEGEQLYGNEATAYNDEISRRYSGPLTDEKVMAILNEFPRIGDKNTGSVSNTTYYPIANLFAERSGEWNGKTVSEVFPGFEEPPQLGSSSRWEAFLYSMTYIVLTAGIVIVIIVSPIFSEEYSSGMDALILTARYGKKRCVRAKIVASFCFVLVYVVLVLSLGLVMFVGVKGTGGWDTDIQLSELMLFSKIPVSLKCYEAIIYMVILSVISMLTLNGMVLMLSVISKTSFVSVIASSVVYLSPIFLVSGSRMKQQIMMMLPANSLISWDVLQLDEVHVGSLEVSHVTIIGLLMMVVVVAAFFVCVKVFSRHEVVA